MKRIIGILKTKDNALQAVDRLKEAGFADNEISVLLKDKDWTNPLKNELSTNVSDELYFEGRNDEEFNADEFFMKLGALVVPLGGPVLAAGPIANAMTTYAGGRSLCLWEVLEEYEVDKDYMALYLECLEEGHVMVLVDEDEIRKEKAILSFYDESAWVEDLKIAQ